MNSKVTLVFQLIASVIQVGNIAAGVVPAKWQPVVAGVVALAQIIQARYAHNWNPDGTPASVAYVKPAALLLALLLIPGLLLAQTPAPTTSSVNLNIGAAALGLGGTSQATPASDVILTLNPGFTNKYLQQFEFRSDNVLAPGANLQAYLAGANWQPPVKFPANSIFAPLSFYVDATVGLARIVPASGPVVAHVGWQAGGGLRWQTSSGVRVNIFEINALHTPGAPWGSTAPSYSGGLSYVWGKH